MPQESLEEVLARMDQLWDTYIRCKARFPYIEPVPIGTKQIRTAPIYWERGAQLVFDFGEDGLTLKLKEEMSRVGHWVNQNFVVRLYAMMEYYKLVSDSISIDQGKPGWDCLDLVRRLRNRYAHTVGEYNARDGNQKRLFETLDSKLGLGLNANDPQHKFFPASIDSVNQRLFDGCKEYARNKYRTQTSEASEC
jgi:hypothetical protein